MASSPDQIEVVMARLRQAAVYFEGRVVGLICDGQLFLKPAAAELLPEAETAPPYPGAKPHIAADDRFLADTDLVARALQAIAAATPPPRRRAKKAP